LGRRQDPDGLFWSGGRASAPPASPNRKVPALLVGENLKGRDKKGPKREKYFPSLKNNNNWEREIWERKESKKRTWAEAAKQRGGTLVQGRKGSDLAMMCQSSRKSTNFLKKRKTEGSNERVVITSFQEGESTRKGGKGTIPLNRIGLIKKNQVRVTREDFSRGGGGKRKIQGESLAYYLSAAVAESALIQEGGKKRVVGNRKFHTGGKRKKEKRRKEGGGCPG